MARAGHIAARCVKCLGLEYENVSLQRRAPPCLRHRFGDPRAGRPGALQLNNLVKNLVIWLVIGLVLMTVFNQFSARETRGNTVP